jgi:alcohol sulfotransferase
MKDTTLPSAQPFKVAQVVGIVRQGAMPALRLLTSPSTLVQLPRLFSEGFAPARRMFVQARNNREMARLIKEKTRIAFVSSFGRSGNTWMRYLLSDIILQNRGTETTTELAQPSEIVPDYYTDLITPRARAGEATGYLIKTHDLISVLGRRVGVDIDVRQCKYLYLYRTPEDALVSVFHLSLREKYIRSKSGRDIDLFCLEFLPQWIEHIKSYLDALEEGVDIHLVAYDQLLQQTTAVLRDTLDWLGIPFTVAAVDHANSNMEFSKLKAMEAKTLGGRIPFFRRGSHGSGALELKPETLSEIRNASKHLLARANESLARQSLRTQTIRDVPPFSVNRENWNGNEKVLPTTSAAR